jgi:hypothetical protein
MRRPTWTHSTAAKRQTAAAYEDAASAGWPELADRLARRRASTVIDTSILLAALAIFATGAMLAP